MYNPDGISSLIVIFPSIKHSCPFDCDKSLPLYNPPPPILPPALSQFVFPCPIVIVVILP